MKKLFLLLAALLCISTSFGQKQVFAMFAVKTEINAQCPMVIDELTTLQSADYHLRSKYFTYNYSINEEMCSISLLKENLGLIAERIPAILEEIPDSEAFITACINANVEIMFKYTGDRSGESCCIIYNPKTRTTTTN